MKLSGVVKQGEMVYEQFDGSVKKYLYRLVRIEFMGEVTAGKIIFGNKDVESILCG